MTKPAKIALGIGVAGLACAALAFAGTGMVRVAWAWTAGACAIACAAYVANRPGWLGKRDGRLTARALLLLPYLIAFRIAIELIRWRRGADAPTRIVPGLWVAGRIAARDLPPGATRVVDLVAEYAAPRAVRALPGYSGLPILDGGVAPDLDEYRRLVCALAAERGEILVHCDSGRGRAPTLAAAVLVARGLVASPADAVALVRRARPVAAPTRTDLVFLAAVCAALPAPRAADRPAAAPAG